MSAPVIGLGNTKRLQMSEKNERLNNRNRQLASAIDFLRIVPDPDFESKKNTLVARDVVRNECILL